MLYYIGILRANAYQDHSQKKLETIKQIHTNT